MNVYLQQTWGVFSKDMRQWARDWQAAFGPMMIPLVLLLICSVLFGYGGDEWNIGLIVEDNAAPAQALVQAIEDAHGNISPYFRIITRDAGEAQKLAQAGRLQMVITVPADFSARLASHRTAAIETRLFNVNTDMTKNMRLRLEHALQDFAVARGKAPVTVAQYTTRTTDIWRRAFIAGSAVILAILVGASLNTAIMIACEWERHTSKEIRLAPHPVAALATGTLLAGLASTVINVAITLAVAVGLFGLRIPSDRWLPLFAFGLGVALATAGIGLGLGAMLRDYRTVQPLVMVTAAGSFFVAGGFSSVGTLPPAVRAFDAFWLPAYAFETMQAMMHGATLPNIAATWLVLLLVIAVCMGFGTWMLWRAVSE